MAICPLNIHLHRFSFGVYTFPLYFYPSLCSLKILISPKCGYDQLLRILKCILPISFATLTSQEGRSTET